MQQVPDKIREIKLLNKKKPEAIAACFRFLLLYLITFI